MPLLPGLLIVTVGALVLGGVLRFLEGVARQMEPHDQRRQGPPPPPPPPGPQPAPERKHRTLNDYWREEIAKMTQSQLIAEIANRNAIIAYRKEKLTTETDDVERFITVTWLGNAEIQQRMMYDEMIRRRKQCKERAA
jgi:hypothetical protein